MISPTEPHSALSPASHSAPKDRAVVRWPASIATSPTTAAATPNISVAWTDVVRSSAILPRKLHRAHSPTVVSV